MRKADLHIEELKKTFENSDYFQVADLFSFYQSLTPSIPKTTVNWRINSFVKSGLIHRIGRGKYKWGAENVFLPEISSKIVRLNNLIKNSFPYLDYLIWHIAEINSLSQHLFNKDIFYVEVEFCVSLNC